MRFAFRAFRLSAFALSAVLLGCTTSKEDEERGTKVLMIGNAFSISLLQHLPQVAADRGVELDLASLYIDNCSFKGHWENVRRDGEENYRPYNFGRNRFGKYTQAKANICDVLRMAKWDVVTVQQVSHESWMPGVYRGYGELLIARIRELAPQARIYIQELWSYTPWDKRLAEWGLTQDEMYAKIHVAHAEFAKRHGVSVIPFGTAVQEWRRRLPVRYAENSLGGDVVGGGSQDERDHFKRGPDGRWVPNCDLFNLGPKGQYFQALVWARVLFGVDFKGLGYKPSFVEDSELKLMTDIATGLK